MSRPTLALFLSFVAAGCVCSPPASSDPSAAGFHDDFERAALGADWNDTGADWRIENGELSIRGAHNHPLWLRRTLPRDVRIEFDVRSESPEGDIKVEVFGDGTSYATADSYTATSYVVIFGGWGNSLNVLARLNEHGDDRVVGPTRPVEANRDYHMRIERSGGRIAAWVDDELLVEMNDERPLSGTGHDHFGFNDWNAQVYFDDLVITPL